MFKQGVIVGKFYPFHKGHAHLIRSASEQCESLTVLVCSLPTEQIPGGWRYRAVREAFPNVTVLHVADVLPQEPSEHPDFWAIWTNVVKRRVPNVDVLFTSEDYGEPFAQHLGVAHVCIDKQRITVPISGTRIRSSLSAYWNFVMPTMKPYFQRRIAIIGPESTGKTTLACTLARSTLYSTWVPEYGREYVQHMNTRELTAKDFLAIATGHALRESQVDPTTRFVFTDTDAFTTLVFYDLYRERNEFVHDPGVRQELVDMANRRPYDLYLLTNIDLPWKNDGQRDFEDRRADIMLRFYDHVQGYPYELITGTTPHCRPEIARKRLNKAIGEWDSMAPSL